MAKHVRKTIGDLISKWKKEDFNDVRMEVYLTGEYKEGYDETKKEWEARSRDYAIFTLVPYFPTDLGYYESFDEDAFWRDLNKTIQNELPDCNIRIYDRAQEIEVERC